MKANKKKKAAVIAYSAALTLFTGFVMLDTFLLPSVEQSDATGMNTDLFADIETVDISEDKAESNSNDADESRSKRERPEKPSGDGNFPKFDGEFPGVGGENGDFPKFDGEKGDFPGFGGGFKPPENSDDNNSSSGERKHRSRPDGVRSSRSKEEVEEKVNENMKSSVTPVSHIGEYSDENMSISVDEYYELNTHIYVADIKVSSAQYLKTALANGAYGKNVTASTSEIAESAGAKLAINGDFYGAKETGYVLRNGILYRNTASNADILTIYADGSFGISGQDTPAEEIAENKAWQIFSFGPGLVVNGELTVDGKSQVGKEMASNPRTVIAEIEPLHYLFIVSDGRTEESEGLSLYGAASFAKALGAKTAYNLDGGGSSTMYFNGQVINHPTTMGNNIKEREVSDIVYIG